MSIYKTSDGEGEEVVLLHGWGCDHQHVKPVAEQLSRRYRVSNFDLPGRGKSHWSSHIESIHDVADQLLPHLPLCATYMGWSFGGLVAMSIASRFPQRVKRLIGVATTPRFVEDAGWPGIPSPGFSAFFREEIGKIGYKPFATRFYESEFSDFTSKPQAYHTLLAILETETSDVDILMKGINICDKTDLRNALRTLNCPVDLILGGKDDSLNIDSVPNIKALNPSITVHIIPEAKHMPFWTHPREFNDILKTIL